MSNDELEFNIIDRSALDEVLAIENAVHVSPWSEAMFHDCFDNCDYRITGLFKDKTIIGYAVLRINPPEAELHNVAICNDLHHRGFGKAFIKQIIEQCVSLNLKQLFLEVRQTNIAAIKIYQTVGFSQVGIRKNYYKTATKTESALVFALDLQGLSDYPC